VRRLLALVVVIAMVCGAVALSIIALPLSRYEPIEPSALQTSGSVDVVPRQTDVPRAATVRLTWSTTQTVPLTGVTGRVTAILVASGEEVACAAPAIEVDGRVLLTYCAERPMWREISGTTKGRDVDEFDAFLVERGLMDADDVGSGSARVKAVKALQGFLGLRATGTVAPADFVWMSAPFTPTVVNVEIGERIADDATLMTSEARLVEAIVEPLPDGDRPLLFGVDGSAERITVSDTSGRLDAAATEAVVRAGEFDPEKLPTSVNGTVRLSTPVEVWAVPASGIVSSTSGSCVAVVSDSSRSMVPVEIVESNVGTVLVAGQLNPANRVVAEPGSDTRC
jgi:hypothetical protein